MIGIRVEQYLNGQWVNLIDIPSEDAYVKSEDIQESLDTLRQELHRGDSGYIHVENEVVMFNKADGPMRMKWTYLGESETI